LTEVMIKTVEASELLEKFSSLYGEE